jgi:hypothetical protein
MIRFAFDAEREVGTATTPNSGETSSACSPMLKYSVRALVETKTQSVTCGGPWLLTLNRIAPTHCALDGVHKCALDVSEQHQPDREYS